MTTHQEFESAQLNVPKSLYRASERSQKTEAKPWQERPFLDLILLFLIPFAAWLLVASFFPQLDFAKFVTQLGNAAILLGLPGLVLGLLAFGWRLRWRINHYERWWNNACPACAGDVLKRKRRKKIDRMIGRLGIPVRRYICGGCHWEGRLIDETRVF